MAMSGKKKSKVWFTESTGFSDEFKTWRKVPSTWNPGKSKKKHNRKY